MKRLIPILLIFLFFSCAKKEDQEQRRQGAQPETIAEWLGEELDLSSVIVQTPASIVSAKDPLDIEFRDPVVPDHLKGNILDKNPFTFDPKIEGHALWLSRRILRFVPDGNLPPGKEIRGKLLGKIAFGEQKSVNDFHFSFKVAEQEVLSLVGDFESIPEVGKSAKYRGIITFAQAVNIEKIRSDLILRGPQGRIGFTCDQEEQPEKISILSDVITRTEEGQTFVLSLPKRYTADKKEWEKSIYLPGIGVFQVITHMDMTTPDADQPIYGFRFSDPIKKDIDLSGYVTLAEDVPYQVRIKGKYLLIQGDFIPGMNYSITVAQGFPSVYGTKTTDEYRAEFSLSNIKPEMKWLSKGVYLPADNKYKLQFESVNVGSAEITITEIFPQNIGFFIQRNALSDQYERGRSGYYYRSRSEDLSRVGESIHKEKIEITDEKNKWVKTELDLGTVFEGKSNSVFVVKLRFTSDDLTGRCVNDRMDLQEGDLFFESEDYYNNPCRQGYYYSRGELNKLLISSNIGLTVKRTEDGLHVYATDVLSARPIRNLELSLFSYQNRLLETRTTDGDGYVHFSEEGAYIYGKNSDGIALIKHTHPTWQTTTFDVAGSMGGLKGVNVYMYTDRGVHRPGDTVHLSAIIRMGRAVPPEKQPVLLKVKNPKGQVVYENKTNCGFNGHVYFKIPTDPADPTGSWFAEFKVGDQTFGKELKIETVKPNRLKIAVDSPGIVRPPEKSLKGTVTCKYLFGAPAANLKAKLEVSLSGKNFTAEKFRDYNFYSPLKQYSSRTRPVYEGKLDAEGVYRFDYEILEPKTARGLIQAVLRTTVYEKGGSFVTDSHEMIVYPYEALVGVKDVFEWGSARVGESYELPIVVVDDRGEIVEGHELKVKVYVNREHWWWHYDRRDRKDFRQMESTYLIGEYTYHSGPEPITHKMSIEDYGRHFVEIIDVVSKHEAGLMFYASQWGRPAPAEEKDRNYLQIVSNKNVYQIGDRATLSFDTPGEGMVLFTLEQGKKLFHREWKPVQDRQTAFSFQITEDLIPNCYASISLIQPHNQNTNDLPMRLYGIKTIYVEDETTRLPLQLSVPGELAPKQSFTVDVTSRAPYKATYTIAIVDEGLLDLTAFDTPAPWDFFFEKIGLQVGTTDNFDQIIGILYPDIERYFSIGGGLEEMPAVEVQRRKRLAPGRVRRFKPVVLFQEPVTIEPGRSVKTHFTMPNYIGLVRVMVVGASGHSYTSLEESVPVKHPLMILPTLPRVARPGDIFDLPVSVFAMDSTIREAELSLSLSDNLRVEGSRTVNLMFEKPGEKDASFSVGVGNAVGADTVTTVATSGPLTADYTVYLPITSPNPFYTEVTDTTVMQDQSVVLFPEKFGLEGTNKAKIAFSRMPDIQLDKRLNYLIRYPYGCIEQTVSSVFPQLYLPYLLDLKPYQKQMVTDNINAGIEKLSRFKMDSGFSFWPVSAHHRSEYSEWGSSYVGHFLLEARALGYHVPGGLYDHWLKDARKKAKKVDKKNHRYQTYRLFLLAFAGKPHIGAMNLIRENYLPDLDPLSRKLLAAAYYVSGKKDVAREVNRSAPTEIQHYREMGGTYGSALRDRALMTYISVIMENEQTAAFLLREVAKSFGRYGWYSTQEVSMALLSIGTYYKLSPFTGGSVSFRVKMGDEAAETVTLDEYQLIIDLENMWGKEITVTNDSNNMLFVTLFEEGIPIEDRIETDSNGIQLTRNFYSEDGLPITVNERKQGDAFWVVYTAKSVYSTRLEELALSSVFPSGWEIINMRLTGKSLPEWITRMGITSGDYMDIRDDRVNWFFDLDARRKASFVVKINPTFKGTFTLPPVIVEAMYSPEFYAHIEGGKITVE